jgi:acetyl esterase
MYEPDNIKTDKTLLFFHGGGYVLGSVETHHNFVASMSMYLGMKIYSLEYSLSPENKFPIALSDAKKAYLRIMQEHANKKILLCGDSAGAHLVAALSYDLCKLNKPSPLAQILIYPMICPSLNYESMELYKENFLLTKSSMQWFWEQLRLSEADDNDPRFNLLKQDKVNELQTKTLIVTAGFDPLHDEGIAYADLLEKNGNEVERLNFEGLIHGFVNLTNIREADASTIKIFETLKQYLN